MKRILLSVVSLLAASAASAQIELKTETAAYGNMVDFVLETNGYPGTITVFLTLSDLYNCKNMTNGTTKYEMAGLRGRLLTLRASDESYGVGYSSSWRYFRGRIDPTIDTTIVYRMPVSTGRAFRVLATVNVIDKYSNKSQDERQWLGYSFPMEKGDTVFAARKGVVVNVERGKHPASGDSAVSYSSESTNIIVEHPDGGFARYVCLDDKNLFVETGDVVFPGSPLALAGTYDGEHYKTALQTYWQAGIPDPEKIMEYRYFKPRFATERGAVVFGHGEIYTAVMTDEMLTCEMNKKELKQHAGNKK